jgi:hypothetical protein
MRWLGILFVFILILIFLGPMAGYFFIKEYPYGLYSNWIEGREWNKYYQIPTYSTLYLRPTALEEAPLYREDYPQLWKSFPLRNSLVPLPTRHPLFLTLPLIEFEHKGPEPVVGMSFLSSDSREISRLYNLPMSLGKDYSLGQELFKLPFVRNRIMKLDPETVWKEAFTHIIDVRPKSIDEMIHDLYILHIRSQLLPEGTIKYSLLENDKALIELSSSDKDYVAELILSQHNGSIYSYALKTAKNNQESLKLRAKFLKTISFSPIDPDLGTMLYTEFKHLNFSRQIDQEGLLYLFSAWSQDLNKVDILKEMIFYLERGKKNGQQLKTLYQYAFMKYGKTFTTRNIFSDSDDPELIIQRKIEIENIQRRHAAERELTKKAAPIELTPNERMKMNLRKAKEIGPAQKKDMTVF